MGIISSLAGYAAGKAAEMAAEKAKDVAVEKAKDIAVEKVVDPVLAAPGKAIVKHDENRRKRDKERIAADKDGCHLLVEEYVKRGKSYYEVRDPRNGLKYVAQVKKDDLIIINDGAGMEVATVRYRKKRLGLKTKYYDIVIRGVEIGNIQAESNLLMWRCKTDFNGWTAEEKIIGCNYKIMDGAVTIAEVSNEYLDNRGHVIDFYDPQNELLIVAFDALIMKMTEYMNCP